MRVLFLSALLLVSPLLAGNFRYEINNVGRYSDNALRVTLPQQSFERAARVAIFAGAIAWAASGGRHSDIVHSVPHSNPHFTYDSHGTLIVNLGCVSTAVSVAPNTVDDYRLRCEARWQTNLDYAAHVARCFDLYSHPKFIEYAYSVAGFREAVVELYHKGEEGSPVFRKIAEGIIAREPHLYDRVKKKAWRSQLGEKLQPLYQATSQHHYDEQRVVALQRIEALQKAFDDSPVQKICDAATHSVAFSEAYNKKSNRYEAQKSLDLAILLLSLGESLGLRDELEIAKASDELVCFFLTHIHKFLEDERPSAVAYGYVIKGLKYEMASSNKIEDKIKRADLLTYTAFWNNGERPPRSWWRLQDSVKRLPEVSPQISDIMDKVYVGARDIVTKGGYYAGIRAKENRKHLLKQRATNYKEMLHVHLSHNKQLVSFGYKIVQAFEKYNHAGDIERARIYKYRIDAVIRTLQDPNAKTTNFYNSGEFTLIPKEMKHFTGTPIQQCLHREIVRVMQDGIFLDRSIKRPEVGMLTDISCTAATLAFECNKVNEHATACGFIDFARGMGDTARSVETFGGLRGAARGLPIYIGNFAQKLGSTSLFIGKRVMSGFAQGALDIQGVLNGSLKEYMKSHILEEDILGDAGAPLEFLKRNEKLFELRRERMKNAWNNFWEERKKRSVKENVGGAIEFISRATFDAAAIIVAIKAASITSSAIYVASMKSGGILAAKEFLQPLVREATAAGTVTASYATPSASAAWQSAVVSLGQAIPILMNLAEPVAHLFSSMQSGDGAGGGGSGSGKEEANYCDLGAPAFKFKIKRLQHMFCRHGKQFGMLENWNKASALKFEKIIRNHVQKATPIKGTYRGIHEVIHYFDPHTNLNVIVRLDGYLEGGWRLSSDQVKYLLSTGAVK